MTVTFNFSDLTIASLLLFALFISIVAMYFLDRKELLKTDKHLYLDREPEKKEPEFNQVPSSDNRYK